MMLIIQAPNINWWEAIKTVGLPVVYLGVTIYFIKYMLWPMIQTYRDESNSRITQFLSALEKRDEVTNKAVAAIEKLNNVITEFRDEVRRDNKRN